MRQSGQKRINELPKILLNINYFHLEGFRSLHSSGKYLNIRCKDLFNFYFNFLIPFEEYESKSGLLKRF